MQEDTSPSTAPAGGDAAAPPAAPAAASVRRAPETAPVLSLEDLGSGYRRLRLAAPRTAAGAAPGQFVHVRVPALDASAMRRPISICDADPAAGVLTLLFKVVGRGTAALAAAREGDRVDLMGPLGNGFPLPPEGAAALLVGGGYGVAPLHFLARRILARSRAGGVRLFAGGRTASDLLLLDDFRALGVEVHPATDDGSLGTKGLVTVPLDAFLDGRGGVSDPATPPPVLYACGPGPMLRAVDERAQARGLAAWLSLDRRMLCGVGACLGCTQAVRVGGSVATARVCADGPVFPQGRIVWD